MKRTADEKVCDDKGAKIYRPAAVFSFITGLLMLMKVPESPNTSELIWNILTGIVFVGSGVWLWNKKKGNT